MVATAHAAQQTLGKAQSATRPYLATLGAPALRFQDPAPVPPPTVKPIASGPPVAASAPEEAAVSLANDQAAAATPPVPVPAAVSTPTPESTSQPAAEEPAKQASTPTPKALPILPDDTRRTVQSQDFLPLFRLPGSGGPVEETTIVVPGVPTPPAPGTLPPSSATYRVN
ncbi:MAG: hypothetical protein ACOZE5_18650 [Verrucomicrobiota bacterium]